MAVWLLLSGAILWCGGIASEGSCDLDRLVYSNNAFAFDLYRKLHTKEGNVLFSPYSVMHTLAMTYAGARGETQQEMAEVLHFTLPEKRLHRAFGLLAEEFADRDEEAFHLRIASSIWGQVGYPFLPAFKDVLKQHYGVEARELDFRSQPEPSRHAINAWVSQETEGKIEDLIPPGGITPSTRLVLGNAIYFQAAWLHPFEKLHTQHDVFHLLDGGEAIVPMMNQEVDLAYAAGDGWQAVELPYEGGEAAMLILLPDHGRFEEFESTLSAERVAEIVSQLQTRAVCLAMPRFRHESRFELSKTLSAMGMEGAFLPGADFSGMDGTRDLYLDEVYHKAFVAVDEAGTEAATATAVVVAVDAPLVPEPCVQVTVDRPFIFLIQDRSTGGILFMGRIVDPR